MPQPTNYSGSLHRQASDIADRIVQFACSKGTSAYSLASGPVADEIAEGADCCIEDQLGLAVMLASELAMRTAAHPIHP